MKKNDLWFLFVVFLLLHEEARQVRQKAQLQINYKLLSKEKRHKNSPFLAKTGCFGAP